MVGKIRMQKMNCVHYVSISCGGDDSQFWGNKYNVFVDHDHLKIIFGKNCWVNNGLQFSVTQHAFQVHCARVLSEKNSTGCNGKRQLNINYSVTDTDHPIISRMNGWWCKIQMGLVDNFLFCELSMMNQTIKEMLTNSMVRYGRWWVGLLSLTNLWFESWVILASEYLWKYN